MNQAQKTPLVDLLRGTPEIIYLIPGEDIEGYPEMVWCESSAPSDHCDPEEAVKYVRADTLPVVTDNGKVNVGLIAENERLQVRVSELEAEEEGAKEAFGVIVDKMKDLRSRNLQIEKTIHRQVIEISRLYRSGARPLRNDADKVGGDND